MSIDELVGAADATAELADRLGRSFARMLASVLRDLERQLGQLVKDAADTNRTAIVKAARANRTRNELRDLLTKAGFDEMAARATDGPLDKMAESVLRGRRLAKASAELTTAAENKAEALKALHLGDLLDEGEELTRALYQATVRGVFGSRDSVTILKDLYRIVDRTQAQIETLYDTAISIYGRQVEALAAGDDPEATFAYMGPADAKNREFCAEHVGKVYTRAEINKMDNGQLNDVFLTAGGYNCRHGWMEVSKFSALQPLVGTGERIPEVAAQLKAAA